MVLPVQATRRTMANQCTLCLLCVEIPRLWVRKDRSVLSAMSHCHVYFINQTNYFNP